MRHGPAHRTRTQRSLPALVVVLACLGATTGTPPPLAHATSPGRNGVLSFTGQTRAGVGIYNLAPATGSIRAQPGTGNRDTYPQWSPDGRSVAFTRYTQPLGVTETDSESEVWVVAADGKGARQLTDLDFRAPCTGTPEDRAVGWSPDGAGVLYISTGWNGGPDAQPARGQLDCPNGTLWTAELGGAPAAELGGRHGGCTNVVAADPSPDGARLALTSQQAGCRSLELFVSDANWGALRALPTGPGEPWAVSWSPDGRRLAYEIRRGRTTSVAVIGADGRGRRRLATGSKPVWSPDGRRIAFIGSDRTRGGVIATITPNGTRRRTLVAWELGRRPFLNVLDLDWQPRR